MLNTYIGGSLIYGMGSRALSRGYWKCEEETQECDVHEWRTHVTSECTALLSRRLGFGGVSDSGFSSCAVPTSCGSKYFYNQCPQVRNVIGTEHSLNRSEHRVKKEAS